MAEQAFWLAWSQIPGIGAISLQRLQTHFGSLRTAWEAEAADLIQVEGLGPQTIATIEQIRNRCDPWEQLSQHQEKNPYFWTPIDSDYPRWLLQVPDPPPILYYAGKVEPLENAGIIPAVAIVGTRRPSDYGRRWACRLSSALAQAGFTLVSGLAEGIDTEAHQSCLAVGGRTIAVLGTGVDQVYPAANRHLSQQIMEQGLLLSEFPATTPPDRSHFPRRNRIIAGLCRATLVIEAPKKSGSLITARLANEYGREVYALPGTLDNSKALGCIHLLAQGALVIEGEAELLELLGTLPPLLHRSAPTVDSEQLSLLAQSNRLEESQPLNLPPVLEQVWQSVGLEPIGLDGIVKKAGLATGEVSSALIQLELMGLVSQLPGMRYQRG